jgi:hypothetical protein
MKFTLGDATDTQHCVALQHEFLRCHDAFVEFASIATQTITSGDNPVTSFRMYNSYARFLHHLYEFMAGALVRDHLDTKATDGPKGRDHLERYITGHAARLLQNKRETIEKLKVPGWQQALAGLPNAVPPDFGKELRRHRNTVLGHVKHQRAKLNLRVFFDRYHFFMFMLYRDSYHWWGQKGNEIPDLNEITSFSVLVKQKAAQITPASV